MPALLSPLLVRSLFGFQLFDGPNVSAPPEVLSLWEVRRLRSRYGITLGSLLGRWRVFDGQAWRDHEPEHDSIAFFRPTTWDEARRVQCPGVQPRDCAWPSTAG
ncbi:hypothetical protein GCM10010493_37330 [Streptomyces lavendulae subsp. grasserius]